MKIAMAFTEAQQEIIDKVINSSMKDDFDEDRAKISQELDPSLTQDQKDAEYFSLAQEYIDLAADKADEEAEALTESSQASTKVETENLQSSLLESKEQFSWESYTVYEVLSQYNSPFLQQIQSQLSKENSKETVESFCEQIEKVWRSYIEWSLKTALPETTIKTMATGLSFYFMDRLKRSGADAGQIAKNAEGLTKWNRWTKISNMIGTFGQIAGFGEVMGKINRAVEVINTHGSSIILQESAWPEWTMLNPSCAHIFTTPHGFYDWIQGSLALNPSNLNYRSLNFEQVFASYQTRSNAQTLVNAANNLEYNAWVHKLMDKVIHEGNSVLELRNEAKSHVKEIFATVQWLVSQLSPFIDIGGVSEMLDSVGLRGVADFVCLLLGFGTVKWLEKEHREQLCDFTPAEKNAIALCVSYAQKYGAEYTPTTHDDPASFLHTSGLKDIIDQHNTSASDEEKIHLTSFPTSTDLIIESFAKWFETVLPDPAVLMNIPGFAWYVETNTDKDGNQLLSITADQAQREELKKNLQDPDIVQHFVHYTLSSYSDPAFLAKFSAMKEWQVAQTPDAFIGLLFTSCVSPVYADKAWEFDVLERSTWGAISVWPLLGLGAAAADQALKERHTFERKALEDAVTTAKSNLETAKLALETEQKKETIDVTAMNNAKTEVTKAEQALKDAEDALAQAQSTDSPVADADPRAVLVAATWAAAVSEPDSEHKEKSYDPDQQREVFPDPEERYTAEFAQKVIAIAKELNTNPNWLMQVMEKETWWTFSSSIKNAAWSGATGLIQFMQSTAESLGTTTRQLATMSPVVQLDYVQKYLEPYKDKLTNLASVYTAVFYPAALDDVQSEDMQKVIFTKTSKDGKELKAYKQNKWMDKDNNGDITIQDMVDFVSGGWPKEYFKAKEAKPETVAEPASINLSEKSIPSSQTVLFGASNAGTIAWVLEDKTKRKWTYSFPGKNTTILKTQADKLSDWWTMALITSTVNNYYSTETLAQKAADDIQAIAQKAIAASSIPVIVLYPDPTNRSDKAASPTRYAQFQYYNELMKKWCQSYTWDVKPKILDLSQHQSFQRASDGYHVDQTAMKSMLSSYLE